MVMSLQPCLLSPRHFPGDSHNTLATGEDCRHTLPAATGDLPHTGVPASISLKFEALGVGCSEYASEEA